MPVRFRTLAVVFLSLSLPVLMVAQERRAHALITQKIDESRLARLAGNTRSEARAENDRGRVADDFPMEHMLLQLQRSPESEQAVQALIDQLHDSQSANFHKWMTAAQFGQQFSPAQSDLDAVTGWLGSRGFTVNTVYPSGMLIDFSGNAGQVREAFRTEIHHLQVKGEPHLGNMSDPMIPEALAPVVAGVVALHDFMPHAMNRRHPDYTFTSGGSTQQAVVPGDLATIYNLNPLFSAGITGKGQTVAVIEDTDLFSPADWTTFRSTFGLTQYASGNLTTAHPSPSSGRNNCADPGVNGDDGEATLDAEWASAAAPNATIEVASCANTRTTFGGLIALQNLVNGSNPPAVVSISYGNCEAENGAASNATFNSLYQQAVAEGISVFVSAGDEGAASCDAGADGATHGIGVSGWASTPYNVAAGGTDFGDSVAGSNSAYWSATNSATFESAISYVPEIPWNDSCASSLLAGVFGFSTTFGSSGFCGSSTASKDQLLTVTAGSGGPSGCATGNPSTSGVVSGTCRGYAKPSWQTGVTGIPNDGVRDIPDVSLFAGNGVWGHYYVYCFSDRHNGGVACTGAPSTWAGAGGTSFSSPILAGIQALVNQKTGAAQGNPNFVYYKLAASEYGTSGSSTCNSTNGNATAGSCIFYNVTQGDIDVNCGGSQNCFDASTPTRGRRSGNNDLNGALSTSTQSFSSAYGTSTGWNFATGIGSVNVFNLVNAWPSGH